MTEHPCRYTNGTHYWQTPFYLPVQPHFSLASMPEVPREPAHWIIYTCKYCGHEKHEARGFTPRRNGEP